MSINVLAVSTKKNQQNKTNQPKNTHAQISVGHALI